MPLPGSEAPSLEGVDWVNGGTRIDTGTHLLNFWHSSCISCIDRLEEMDRLHSQHPGVESIAVHVPELGLDRDAARKVADRVGVGHHVAHDAGGLAESYGPGEGVFLLHDGKVEWQKTPGNSFRELEQRLEELTGENPSLDLEAGESEDDRYLGHSYGDLVNDLNFRGERKFEAPSKMVPGRVYLDGRWRRGAEALEALDGRLMIYRESGRAGLVASASGLKDVEVRVDGEPVPHSRAGEDLRVEDGRSYVRVSGKRLYSLLDGQNRKLELELEPEQGVRMHRLSFG